jgi:DNA repair exonuclease SbcCD ATPase subunit
MELMKQQIEGLSASLTQLKKNEQLFLQASGLEKQAAKARQDGEKLVERVDLIKKCHDALVEKQTELTGQALAGFLYRMDEALPEGNAYIRLAEKSVAIGWAIGGVERPIQALSGGERVAFDTALAHALGAGILIKEVAELDNVRLELTMARLQVLDPQVILVTCHPPQTVDKNWTVVSTK